MLGVREVTQVGRAFGEKTVGMSLELFGTVVGNDRLKDSGRQLEESANERLRAIEEEFKSASRQAQAKAHETKQRAYQNRDKRSNGKGVGDDPSAKRAAAETVKGGVKQVAGKVTGSDSLEEEGKEQKERGKDEGQAAKHETKAAAHREKADAHKETSDRLRR
jgi:uncharacterized protein YjbJ (UPF0337 family)